MQNAKDTFYTTLQTRLAAINPERTIVIRGTVRPGVLVEENELPSAAVSTDAFRLDWGTPRVDAAQPMPMVALECSIRYATDGTTGNGGMDRGRALSAMDGELSDALRTTPRSVTKMNYTPAAAGSAAVAMATNIFWADPVFGPCEVAGERLARTTTVQVYCLQEAGEL